MREQTMRSDLRPSSKPGSRVEVILDGQPVSLPPLRCSLAAIRSYVERMALERQRIICAILVDGQAVDPTNWCTGLNLLRASRPEAWTWPKCRSRFLTRPGIR